MRQDLSTAHHDSLFDSTFAVDTMMAPQDSLFELSFDTPATTHYRPSLFTTTVEDPLLVETPKALAPSQDWVLGVLYLSLIATAWLLIFYRTRVVQLLIGCWTNRTLNQVVRNGSIFKESIFVPTMFIYLSLLSLFLSTLSIYLDSSLSIPPHNLRIFCIIFVSLSLFALLKILLIRFIGSLFRTDTSFYLTNLICFCLLIGLSLLPLLFLLSYQPFGTTGIWSLCSAFLLACYIIRSIRGVIVTMGFSKFSRLHLFLYLCTAEVLPVLLVGKWVSTL